MNQETTPAVACPVDLKVMRHTPGPWEAKYSPGAGLGVWANLRPALGEKYSANFPLAGNESLPVPKVQIAYETWVQFPSGEWDAMQKANIRLMAAAPDLLEALQEVVAISDRKHDAWDKAKVAIAKALGSNA